MSPKLPPPIEVSPCKPSGASLGDESSTTPPSDFAMWFTEFLPRVDLEPTLVSDVTDGKAYHMAGLNLSRAWMLEGIISELPAADARRKPLTELAGKLKATGLESIRSEHYEGGHWLGSFAVYLVSGRGVQR